MSETEEGSPAVAVTARWGPMPSDDELAAIAAAVEALWPRPVVAGAPIEESPRWRFSGRWWTKPVPSRRDRPR